MNSKLPHVKIEIFSKKRLKFSVDRRSEGLRHLVLLAFTISHLDEVNKTIVKICSTFDDVYLINQLHFFFLLLFFMRCVLLYHIWSQEIF